MFRNVHSCIIKSNDFKAEIRIIHKTLDVLHVSCARARVFLLLTKKNDLLNSDTISTCALTLSVCIARLPHLYARHIIPDSFVARLTCSLLCPSQSATRNIQILAKLIICGLKYVH